MPGVIRDELNLYLKEHGLFFDPILRPLTAV
jgi:FAD/FMN-containing dehydrogenase